MPREIILNYLERIPNTRLRFLEDRPPIKKRRQALFLCDCGNKIERDLHWVRFLNITSCGCYKTEKLIKKNTKHSHAKRSYKSGAYRSWQAMHQRVIVDPRYANRPICDRWCGNDGFTNFYADMGDRPEGLTLERINNDKGYNPHNCKWATRLEQANNTIITKGKSNENDKKKNFP